MSITVKTRVIADKHNGWLINELRELLVDSSLEDNGDLWVQTIGDSICDTLKAKSVKAGTSIVAKQSLSSNRYELLFTRKFSNGEVEDIDVDVNYKIFISDVPEELDRGTIMQDVARYLELYDTAFITKNGQYVIDMNEDRVLKYQYDIGDSYRVDAEKEGADIHIKILKRKVEWVEYTNLPF